MTGKHKRKWEAEDMPAPDHAGPAGRAWRFNLDGARARHNVPACEDASVVIWMIEAPNAHPFWHSYILSLYHLRPGPAWPSPPKLYVRDASHEFVLEAMDPAQPRRAVLENFDCPRRLSPSNFAAQMADQTDDDAAKLIEAAVLDIVAGRLNPDTDFRRQWIERFGQNMVREKEPLQ